MSEIANSSSRFGPWAMRVRRLLAELAARLKQRGGGLGVGGSQKDPGSGSGIRDWGVFLQTPSPETRIPSPSPTWRGWRIGLVAASILAAIVFWQEHDARVHQESEVKQLKKQAAAQVAVFQHQAAAALREADAHAQEVRQLESRRQRLDRTAGELQQRLASLLTTERSQVQQVATLPTSEVARRVATRLGLEEQELGLGGSGSVAKPENASSPNPNPQSPTPPSDATLRKIDAAFVELDSCRAQSAVRDQQVANCREQNAASSAIIGQQSASMDSLQQALAAKDQIIARREAEFRVELKAARGSLFARVTRSLKYVAVGVVIGTVLR